MRYGSLFAGIGGFDLGLDRAGMECAWQVEIDDYCRRVLTKHWPDVPKFEDIRDCGNHNLEPVDLICGGFPCQDISSAGTMAGIKGEKSGLWSEYHRIICELRPRYVVVENVAALLARGIERVLGDLAEGGYNAGWDCIPAAAVGAPHLRDRVFIIGHAYSNGEPTSPVNEKASGLSEVVAHPRVFRRLKMEQPVASGEEGKEASGPLANCGKPRRRSWWLTEPDVGRVADGIPSRVDRLRGLGNAVVPQVAEYIGSLIMKVEEI